MVERDDRLRANEARELGCSIARKAMLKVAKARLRELAENGLNCETCVHRDCYNCALPLHRHIVLAYSTEGGNA